MALETVSKYVDYARELLQDTKDTPYRYSDASLVRALSLALPEAKKLRPDLFLNVTIPTITANDNTVVPMDEMYRTSLVYYMVGIAQLRDDEEVQDQRAAAFLSMFQAKLTTVS
jgi:hypothetical protein